MQESQTGPWQSSLARQRRVSTETKPRDEDKGRK